MKWNLILPAIDEIPIIRGAGVPSGTPPFNGARYLDTTTGVVYLGRNVLNFNGSRIDIPAVTNARKAIMRFWHSDPAPSASRNLHNFTSNPVDRMGFFRQSTTGFLTATGVTTSEIILDGVSISSNAIDPSANIWHSASNTRTAESKIDKIGSSGINDGNFLGRIADFRILGAGDTLLRSYAINEGSGTTIFDSSGNGQHGTLTLGSGSWELTWVPQN